MLKKTLQLIALNFAIIIGVLLVLDVVAISIFQGHTAVTNLLSENDTDSLLDKRYTLPNYKNIDWAYQHFWEFEVTESEYISYIGWRRIGYQGETINIDENGIRITPQSEFVNDQSPVVVLLGGSTLWGTGSNDENTIPSVLSDISHGKYRTVNLGESAYRESQSYLVLLREINNGLKPDIIISYAGVNELYGYRSNLSATSHAREDQIRTVMKGQDTRKSKEDYNLTFVNFLVGPIQSFITRLKTRAVILDSRDDELYILNDDRTEQVAKALLDSWSAMKSLADKNDALFVAALQPNAAIGHPTLDYLEIDPDFVEPFEYLYPEIFKQLEDSTYIELKNNFVDLTAAFDGNDSLYIDFCHVVPKGNAIIAERILEYINSK